MQSKKMNTSLLTKLNELLDYHSKQFVNLAIKRKCNAIKHHTEAIADLINKTWRDCVVMFLMIRKFPKLKSITLSTLGSLPKSNWKTFLDKLNISNNDDQRNTLPIQLFLILVQELISNEKDYKPFWTHAYTELSEMLSSPIEIGNIVYSIIVSCKYSECIF